MSEFIDPVFVKTSPKCSFSVMENERFGLVFTKTGSINSGTDISRQVFMQNLNRFLTSFFLIISRCYGICQNISCYCPFKKSIKKVTDIFVIVSALVRVLPTRWPAVLHSSSPPGSPTSHSGNPTSLHHFSIYLLFILSNYIEQSLCEISSKS